MVLAQECYNCWILRSCIKLEAMVLDDQYQQNDRRPKKYHLSFNGVYLYSQQVQRSHSIKVQRLYKSCGDKTCPIIYCIQPRCSIQSRLKNPKHIFCIFYRGIIGYIHQILDKKLGNHQIIWSISITIIQQNF